MTNSVASLRHMLLGGGLCALIAFILLAMLQPNNYPSKSKYFTYNFKLTKAYGLKVEDPVLLFGYKIGAIKKVYINSNNDVIVNIYVKNNLPIPIDSSVNIKNRDIFGNKVVSINLGIDDDFLSNSSFILNSSSGISLLNLIMNFFSSYSNKKK